MIRIAVCDDDLNNLKITSKYIEAALINLNFEAEIVLATQSQQLITESISNNEIDILFLDIDFNGAGKNGIEFATELRKINKDFSLVFVTAFFEYSLIAYQCKTFGYVLKPITEQSITPVLSRLKAEYTQNTNNFIQLNKDYSIRTKDILFIERNKSKAKVYTAETIYETNYSLNNIQDILPADFVRVHRSYIINQNNIQKINRDEKIIEFGNNLSCPLGQFHFI
ncbi:MAG: response regulator transcription factor [Clostridia bacterium]|nr:response regulator transcription factor [Clostridia bacterium]